MTTADEILASALERLRKIYPPARSVGFYLEPMRQPDTRYHSVVHTDDRGSDALGGGCVLGYGATAADSLDDLCENVRELLAKRQAKSQCVVCREQGVERAGEVTTGDGLMCRAHALEWLQSEKEAAEEVSCRDVGPDSHGRWS